VTLPLVAGPVGSGSIVAHGLGGRTDLPPDARLAALGAAIAVAVSFAIVLAAWPEQRLAGATAGRPIPRVARVVDSPLLTAVLRTLVLAATIMVIAVALFGAQEARFNPAPYALYVGFWVGLALASVLLGPVWPRLNPLRTVHAALCRAARQDPRQGVVRLGAGVGRWPAAVALFVFVWLELVYPQRAEPYVVGLFLTAYCVVTIVAALMFGARWFDAGDGFDVYSRLFGSLAFIGRRADGQLVFRSPLQGLAALRGAPGLAAVVVVLIGSTGFDGLTRTNLWQRHVAPDSVPLGTLGLLALVAAVGVLYRAAMEASARLAGLPARVR